MAPPPIRTEHGNTYISFTPRLHLGIRVRTAFDLVDEANKYTKRVSYVIKGVAYDAKSIMQVMMLSNVAINDLTIDVEGNDTNSERTAYRLCSAFMSPDSYALDFEALDPKSNRSAFRVLIVATDPNDYYPMIVELRNLSQAWWLTKTHGETADFLLRERPAAICVLDQSYEDGLDSFDILRLARKCKSAVPRVLVGATSRKAVPMTALQLCHDYLEKPLDLSLFRRRIIEALAGGFGDIESMPTIAVPRSNEASAGVEVDSIVSDAFQTAGGLRLTAIEALAIRRALDLTNGNREATAKMLGIGERTLYRKIKEYGLL